MPSVVYQSSWMQTSDRAAHNGWITKGEKRTGNLEVEKTMVRCDMLLRLWNTRLVCDWIFSSKAIDESDTLSWRGPGGVPEVHTMP